MCLNRRNNPIVILPIAMMFLVIGILWPRIIHTASHDGQNWDDFLRGGVFGLAIGMLLLTVIRLYRQCRSGQSRNSTET
jgi:hypothetical protein